MSEYGLLSQPVLRDPAYNYGALLPFRKRKAGGPAEWHPLYSDAVAGLLNAFTAPARAYQGQQVDMRDAMNMGLGLLGTNAAVAPLSAPASPGMLGALVFHGSPHKFDKFDAAKIGTGEGAQVYGHGLYFAGHPDTARVYQSQVLDMAKIDAANKRMSELARIMDQDQKPGQYRQFKSERGEQAAREYDALMAKKMEPGSFYHVDLPDSMIARMLDWDNPLGQQSTVLNAINPESMGLSMRKGDNGYMAFVNSRNRPVGNMQKGGTEESFLANWQRDLQSHGTGASLYRWLGTTPAEGSAALNQAGIPGIRYLDQLSRGAGQGTSNYVVFPGNEGMLKILRRE